MRIAARILAAISVAFSLLVVPIQTASVQHLLYVASPGIRNYEEYGGVGILFFDVDNGSKFVRRIPASDVAQARNPRM